MQNCGTGQGTPCRSPESNQESRSKLLRIRGDWFSTRLPKQFNGEKTAYFSRNSAGKTAYSHEQGNQTVSKFNPRWTNQLWAARTPRQRKKKHHSESAWPCWGSDFSGVTKAQAMGTRETPLKCKISAYQRSGSEKALKW